jgi:hypothetical protein
VDLRNGLSRRTRHALEEAGWHAGRAVDTTHWETALVADGFPCLHPAAHRFLAEFGGISVAGNGAGVTRAREPFTLDPTDCLGEADRFVEWSEHVDRRIAPIGELAGNTCSLTWLGVDENEEVYAVVDSLASFGRMPQAMEHLILGYMPKPVA